MKLRTRVVVPLCLVFGGCASSANDWNDGFIADIQTRTNASVINIQSEEQSAARAAAVQALLSQPLTAESAVQIALLNNRSVQSRFAELGIAESEVMRAGTFANPLLDADLKFFDAGVKVEAGLVQSIVGLMLVPLRTRIAEEQFAAEKARITGEIVGLASQARIAFIEYVAAAQIADVRTRIAEATALSTDFAARLHRAGNSSDLELLVHRAQSEEARLELSAATDQVTVSRERVNDLLGIDAVQTGWTAAARLPEPSGSVPEIREIENLAVESNLELQAARHAVSAAANRAGIAPWAGIFESADAGVQYEREPDGASGFGPSLALPLPFFSWGSADQAAARSELRRIEEAALQKTFSIRASARAVWSRVQSASRRSEHLKTTVIPLRLKVTAETQKHHNAMLTGAFELFAAKKLEIESGITYVDALKDYWTARAELDRILAGVAE